MLMGFLTYCFIISCDSQGKANFNKIQPDSVLKDIPVGNRGEYFSSYIFTRQIEKKLNLDELEKGYDSIQIRIWRGFANTDSSQLIILKSQNDEWKGFVGNFKFFFNERNELISINKKIEQKSPRSSWNGFMRRINEMKINDLPDCNELSNYPQISGGENFIFEIATKRKYRIYNYPEPDMAKDEIWQAKNVIEIFELIEYEFGL